MKIRDRDCMDCKHEWTSPVRLSPHTPNLSGEAVEYCPQCNSRNVVSHPVRDSKDEL